MSQTDDVKKAIHESMESCGRRMNPELNGHRAVQFFINELCDWMLAKHDPRLDLSGIAPTINGIAACSADFCDFMTVITALGIPEAKWREHVHDPATENIEVCEEIGFDYEKASQRHRKGTPDDRLFINTLPRNGRPKRKTNG